MKALCSVAHAIIDLEFCCLLLFFLQQKSPFHLYTSHLPQLQVPSDIKRFMVLDCASAYSKALI